MIKRMIWVLVVGLLMLPGGVLAQDGGLELVSFTDENFGVEGMRPATWTDAGNGLYVRNEGADDVTLLAVQSAPVSSEMLWQSLLPQFGLDTVPELTGNYETPAFAWELYQFDVAVQGMTVRVELALAADSGTTYLVLLQTSPEEFDSLRENVLVPVLDSLRLLQSEDVPYIVEEVTFTGGESGVTLAGTLTIPETEGAHPAVVMMTGSGPQNRDEVVVPGFPIFKLIADHLTRRGIAVLRYDDRGVGQSTGTYEEATLFDFAADGQAAVEYMQSRNDINPDQIGVFGHSEGGVYAAIIGADPESDIAFVISMAGPAVSGSEVLLLQNMLLLEADGLPRDFIDAQIEFLEALFPLMQARDYEAVSELAYQTAVKQWNALTEAERAELGLANMTVEEFAEQNRAQVQSTVANEPFAVLLEYEPYDDWAQVTVPVLAIFGEKDLQVDPEQNAIPLENALTEAENPDFTIISLDDANHLFQEAETGGLAEYTELSAEFAPDFLPTVTDWLLERVDIVE